MTDNDIFENEQNVQAQPETQTPSAEAPASPVNEAPAETPQTAAPVSPAETPAAPANEAPVQAPQTPPPGAPMQNNWIRSSYPPANQGYNPYVGQYGANPVRQEPQQKPEKPKKKHKFLRILAATLAVALVFGTVSGGIFWLINRNNLPGKTPTQDEQKIPDRSRDPEKPSDPGKKEDFEGSPSGTLKSAEEAMAEALKVLGEKERDTYTIPEIAVIMEPAMVAVNCEVTTTISSIFGQQSYSGKSAGSGIIVGENETELMIVTNNHVIADADSIAVQFVDESSIPAYVKGTDSVNDLAVIIVRLSDIPKETMNAIAYAELGDSDALVIGEGVVAIGNALGFGQSVTNGIVSALNRKVTDENNVSAYLIQTNAAINPGNSGGALVNMKGQVVGINSSKYADEAVEGMGFAIPINTASPILENLMQRVTRVAVDDPEKKAYLGISVQDISSSAQQAYGMPAGVYIASVEEGLAADKAGIIKGDIITKFDGEVVANQTSFVKLLTYYEAGETVTITVKRYERGEWSPVELTVTLGHRPVEEEKEEKKSQPSIWDIFGGDDKSGDDVA